MTSVMAAPLICSLYVFLGFNIQYSSLTGSFSQIVIDADATCTTITGEPTESDGVFSVVITLMDTCNTATGLMGAFQSLLLC